MTFAPMLRQISTVSSVEPESITTISSAIDPTLSIVFAILFLVPVSLKGAFRPPSEPDA